MSNNTMNVTVSRPKATGGIWIGKSNAVVPTDATSELENYETLGFISEDGFTSQPETDSEEIKAWGGDVVATPQTSYKETYTYTCIERNINVLKHVYGDANVNGSDSNITVKHNSSERDTRPVVIEEVLTGNIINRTVIPRGKVLEIGEIPHKDGEPISYEITLSAGKDAAGNTSYEYSAPIV